MLVICFLSVEGCLRAKYTTSGKNLLYEANKSPYNKTVKTTFFKLFLNSILLQWNSAQKKNFHYTKPPKFIFAGKSVKKVIHVIEKFSFRVESKQQVWLECRRERREEKKLCPGFF